MNGTDLRPAVEARIRAALGRVDGFDATGARLTVLRIRRDRVTVRAEDARASVAVRASVDTVVGGHAPDHEAIALAAAASKGIAPSCLVHDPIDGVLVTAWAPGPAWTVDDLRNPTRLAELATALRAFHEVRVDLPPFDVVGFVDRYRARAGHGAAAEDDALRDELRELAEVAGRHVARRTTDALGHHDVTLGNIVGARPMLIDWEYAARSDPTFDLATVVALHGLDPGSREVLLDAYDRDRRASRIDREFFIECERLAWLLARVWTRLARLDDPSDSRVRTWTARLAIDR